MRNLWKFSVVGILFAFLSTSIYAYDFSVDGIFYGIESSGTTAAVTYNPEKYDSRLGSYSGDVSIPPYVQYNGKSYKVTSISSNAFAYSSNLKHLFLPNTIDYIGLSAFYLCSGLEYFNIPHASITTWSTSSATSWYTFYETTGTVYLDCEVQSHSDWRQAWFVRSKFSNVIFGDNYRGGGYYDFYQQHLDNVYIKSGCNKFYLSLEGSSNPTSVSKVYCEASVPPRTYDLRGVTVYVPSEYLDVYKNESGWNGARAILPLTTPIVHFKDYATKAICVKQWDKDGDGELSLQEAQSVTSIGNVFQGNTQVGSFEELKYFTGITSIPDNAFNGCNNLCAIEFPSSLKSIGAYAFEYCRGLSSIEFPESLTSIGTYAFAYCSNIQNVTIPGALQFFGTHSFYMCSNLEKLVVEEGCTSIGNSSIRSCPKLAEVELPSTITTIGKNAFRDCTGLQKFTIKSLKCPSLGEDVFRAASISNCELKVEQNALSAYNAYPWTSFKNISKIDILCVDFSFATYANVIAVGENLSLQTTVNPSNTTNRTFEWSSSDSNVATVSEDGVIRGVSEGNVTITAKTTDGSNIEKQCQVTVINALVKYILNDFCPTNIGGFSKDYSFVANKGDIISFDWNTNGDVLSIALDDNKFMLEDNKGGKNYVIEKSGEHKLSVEVNKRSVSPVAYLSNVMLSLKENRSRTQTFADWCSTNHSNSSTSSNVVNFSVDSDAVLSFDWATDTEAGYDKLFVYINGSLVLEKSGEDEGSYTKVIQKGEYRVEFKYVKDDSEREGSDAVEITELRVELRDTDERIDGIYLYDDCVYAFVQKNVITKTSAYTRTFNNTNWQALYVPFSMNYEDWADGYEVARLNDVHQFDDDEDGDVDRTELEVIKMKGGSTEPNTPYVIKAKETGEKTLTLNNTTLYATEENSIDCSSVGTLYTFTGTYHTIPGSEMMTRGYYAFGGGSLIQAASEASNLGAFRWYLAITDRSGASKAPKKINVRVKGEDTETGILSVENERADDVVYDMNGRKVMGKNLKPGVYVRNGKKFVVR